jgi:hypothetical protein
MQSALVLNGAYVDLVRGQLAAQEKKKIEKKKGRLVGDGLPRLLTSREFVRRVTEFEKNAREKEEGLKQRKASREEKTAAMKDWKVLDDARKARNKVIKEEYTVRLKAWEAERDLAKLEHRRASWKKPTLKGLLFSPLPKPGYAVEAGEKTVELDSDADELHGDDQPRKDRLNGDGDGKDSDSENDLPTDSETSSEDGDYSGGEEDSY